MTKIDYYKEYLESLEDEKVAFSEVIMSEFEPEFDRYDREDVEE